METKDENEIPLAYEVVRDGKKVVLPRSLCTVEELLAEANRLERKRGDLVEHASELRDYIDKRWK